MVELTEEVKNYLDITWSEEDAYIVKIINRGKDYLNEKTGTELDFEKDSKAIQLLLDFCRYVYNNSFELFDVNFQREIMSLVIREAVKDRAAKKDDSETNS